MKGFKEFLMQGNLIELAVAFVIGSAFAAVVTAFTAVIMDIIGKFGGVPDFSSVSIGGISIGAFLTAVLSFILIAAVVYFFVVTPYNKYKERTQGTPEEVPTSEDLLTEIRDLLRTQQGGGTPPQV